MEALVFLTTEKGPFQALPGGHGAGEGVTQYSNIQSRKFGMMYLLPLFRFFLCLRIYIFLDGCEAFLYPILQLKICLLI